MGEAMGRTFNARDPVGSLPIGLKLVESKASTTGVIISTYARAGEVKTGSFALEEPSEAELERRARAATEG
jgi:hypothetical protein